MSDASEKASASCQRCSRKPAAVHVRRVADGGEEELYVCRECAVELRADPSATNTTGLMSDPLALMLRSLEESRTAAACPDCGLEYTTFKDKGRLGCATCWRTFSEELDGLLRRFQGATRHHGRSPHRRGEQYERASRIKRLNDELERAVGAEEYERAAKLRDLLKDLIGARQEKGQ